MSILLYSMLGLIALSLVVMAIQRLSQNQIGAIILGIVFGSISYYCTREFGPNIDLLFAALIPYVGWLFAPKSIITHSFLFSLLVAYISLNLLTYTTSLLTTIGTSIGLAFHLWDDLFHKQKDALFPYVSIPVLGSLDWLPFIGEYVASAFSAVWLSINIPLSFVALYIFFVQKKHCAIKS